MPWLYALQYIVRGFFIPDLDNYPPADQVSQVAPEGLSMHFGAQGLVLMAADPLKCGELG